jgi:hypothetical protein
LLGLRVRIPPVEWIFESWECRALPLRRADPPSRGVIPNVCACVCVCVYVCVIKCNNNLYTYEEQRRQE